MMSMKKRSRCRNGSRWRICRPSYRLLNTEWNEHVNKWWDIRSRIDVKRMIIIRKMDPAKWWVIHRLWRGGRGGNLVDGADGVDREGCSESELGLWELIVMWCWDESWVDFNEGIVRWMDVWYHCGLCCCHLKKN